MILLKIFAEFVQRKSLVKAELRLKSAQMPRDPEREVTL